MFLLCYRCCRFVLCGSTVSIVTFCTLCWDFSYADASSAIAIVVLSHISIFYPLCCYYTCCYRHISMAVVPDVFKLSYMYLFLQHYACQLMKRHEFLRKLKKIDFNTKTVRFLMTLQKRGLEKLDHQPIIRYIGFSQILEHSFNSLEIYER